MPSCCDITHHLLGEEEYALIFVGVFLFGLQAGVTPHLISLSHPKGSFAPFQLAGSRDCSLQSC